MNFFPLFADDASALCFVCSEPLIFPAPSGQVQFHGARVGGCRRCGRSTWYDLITEEQKRILRTIPRDGPRYLTPGEMRAAFELDRAKLLWLDRTVEPSANSTWATLYLGRLTYAGLRFVCKDT
jgi:hypothetical protein